MAIRRLCGLKRLCGHRGRCLRGVNDCKQPCQAQRIFHATPQKGLMIDRSRWDTFHAAQHSQTFIKHSLCQSNIYALSMPYGIYLIKIAGPCSSFVHSLCAMHKQLADIACVAEKSSGLVTHTSAHVSQTKAGAQFSRARTTCIENWGRQFRRFIADTRHIFCAASAAFTLRQHTPKLLARPDRPQWQPYRPNSV